MSVASGYSKFKRHIKQDDGTYKLVSQWTNGNTVELDDGSTLQTKSSSWNAAKTHADSAHAPSNAEKNQNAFSNVKVGSTTVSADTTTDTLELVAGNNITLTPDATNDKITIAATDTKYTHPTTSGNKHIPSGGSSGQILRWSADGTAVWGADNNNTYTLGSFGITASATELNYCDGVTSNIQTQLGNKLNSSSVTTSLASTSTTTALAASAGKNLQDQITSLNSDLDNSTTLSEEEKIYGTHFGLPVYQKSIPFQYSETFKELQIYISDHNGEVRAWVDISNSYFITEDGSVIPLSFVGDNVENLRCFCRGSYVHLYSSFWIGFGVITVKYIKL